MPVWLVSALSGILFAAGLAGAVWRRDQVRDMSLALMLQAGMLLLLTAAVRSGTLHGQIGAALVLGILPLPVLASAGRSRRATLGDDPDVGQP